MKQKLLIIDDETILTELLYDHFNTCGYLVYTANNGREAASLLSVQPDLILLDINMPDLDGMTLVQADSQICNLSYSVFNCQNHRAG